ncbi:GTPase [Luteimonas sp. XNQY3]|nr:GTPase [Luteimonas sp. XNQY3]MCD9007450.1 GTPase [Luteimonas sp. XNQY3]
MDHSLIRNQMQALVAGYVPRNVRRIKYRIYDARPQVSALGFQIDPQPFEGTIIAITDDAIVVRTGRADFAVLDRHLITATPEQGAKVLVTPYARRRFDGERADTPEVQTEYTSDGTPYTVKRMILGKAPAKLPIPEPRCPQLRDLVQQLEELPAPDGFRRISHMLVDAGARDVTCVDPLPGDIIKTPPAISFNVATEKFKGRVTVLYDRGGDVYVVELYRGVERIERVDDVYFDDLGRTLEHLIDDGRWRLIQVDILSKGRKSTRH